MRWLLIRIVCLYRRLPPQFKKRRCLFKETCSALALRVAREEGTLACFHALRKRFAGCRPNYHVFYDAVACEWQVQLVNGETASEAEIADIILEPYRAVFMPKG